MEFKWKRRKARQRFNHMSKSRVKTRERLWPSTSTSRLPPCQGAPMTSYLMEELSGEEVCQKPSRSSTRCRPEWELFSNGGKPAWRQASTKERHSRRPSRWNYARFCCSWKLTQPDLISFQNYCKARFKKEVEIREKKKTSSSSTGSWCQIRCQWGLRARRPRKWTKWRDLRARCKPKVPWEWCNWTFQNIVSRRFKPRLPSFRGIGKSTGISSRLSDSARSSSTPGIENPERPTNSIYGKSGSAARQYPRQDTDHRGRFVPFGRTWKTAEKEFPSPNWDIVCRQSARYFAGSLVFSKFPAHFPNKKPWRKSHKIQ